MMYTVYLGIGSNIGDRRRRCEEAVERIDASGCMKVTASSALYLTRPVGGPPQRDYINGVLKVETKTSLARLFNKLKNIEKDMGRAAAERDHPRVIDIDILLYGDMIVRTAEITVPHPRMHERGFVLRGFSEIAPEVIHPVLGKTMKRLFKECGTDQDKREAACES
ncbi:MAG: 2-amino-4-hydroxy-6-hydroxymethyldihydropteridine diphosphokinase [Candidatus Omnitrophota bacterium]